MIKRLSALESVDVLGIAFALAIAGRALVLFDLDTSGVLCATVALLGAGVSWVMADLERARHRKRGAVNKQQETEV